MRGRVRWLGLVLALAGTGACGDGDDGPGALLVTVEMPAGRVGAAVLELTGEGLLGVESTGSARAIGRTTASGTLRIVVAAIGAQPPVVRVPVVNRNAALPLAAVLEASDASDLPLSGVGQIQVRIEPER